MADIWPPASGCRKLAPAFSSTEVRREEVMLLVGELARWSVFLVTEEATAVPTLKFASAGMADGEAESILVFLELELDVNFTWAYAGTGQA